MASFDPNKTYEENGEYSISGGALNQIGDKIRKLEKQIDDMKDEALMDELEELRLRDRNPALKDAWDKYQTVLGLTRKK